MIAGVGEFFLIRGGHIPLSFSLALSPLPSPLAGEGQGEGDGIQRLFDTSLSAVGWLIDQALVMPELLVRMYTSLSELPRCRQRGIF